MAEGMLGARAFDSDGKKGIFLLTLERSSLRLKTIANMNSPVQASSWFLPFVSMHKKPQAIVRSGFSLLELLVVMGLAVLLAAVGAPAVLNPRGGAAVMDKSVLNMSLLLEQARAYAMAHNTYVWVGFSTDIQKATVTATAVTGVSGVSTDINSASSLRSICKPQVFENLELCSIGASTLSRESAVDIISTAGSEATFQRSSAAGTVTFGNLIQFSPSGDARVSGGSVSRWIELGMQSLHGGKADTTNIAAVQVGGLTGQVRVYRP
jgi:prepilin-type N-terminal cleavage/methylation domain-containing protein